MKRPIFFNNQAAFGTPSNGSKAKTSSSAFQAADSVANAVLSKLIADPNGYANDNGRTNNSHEGPVPQSQFIAEAAQETASSITDAENMLNVLPDLSLGMQIVIANILSPNDMLSTELGFEFDSDVVGDVSGSLIEVIRSHFVDVYKIEPQLNKMLEDILFRTGSYALAVIPENSIDHAINGHQRVSMEALSEDFIDGRVRNLGILGNSLVTASKDVRKVREAKARNNNSFYENLTASVSLESDFQANVRSYDSDIPELYLSIQDNPNILKHPILHDKVAQDKMADIYSSFGLGMETDRSNMWDEQDEKGVNVSSLYKPRTFKHTQTLVLKPRSMLDKDTVGHPLVLHLPSESVIPVHVPSNPEEHIGYFVVLDQTGNPIKANTDSDYYRQLMGTDNSGVGANMDSFLNERMGNAMAGGTVGDGRKLNYEDRVRIYMDIVKRDLNERLANGVYTGSSVVSSPEEIYRIMFARACQQMYTQLVFIPLSMFTYMAFDYRENGVGRSLLESTRIIGNLRMVNLFANSRASIKNSINRELVNVTLSPKDKDPLKTLSQIKHMHAEGGYDEFPFRAGPQDIARFIARAGTQYTVTGNPRIPETRVDVQQIQNNHAKVDTEFDELLKKWHLMGIGVTPEAVDMSMSPDFATSVISSNILQAKRALNQQQMLTHFISDFIRKYTFASSTLMDELRAIIDKNRATDSVLKSLPAKMKTDAIVSRFLQTVHVTLPTPNASQLDMQLEAYAKYEEALDRMLKNFMSTELMGQNELGEMADAMPQLIESFKAIQLRRYMRDNNILPELFDLLSKDNKGNPLLDVAEEQASFVEMITPSIKEYLKRVTANRKKHEAEVKKMDLNGGSGGDFGGGGDSWDNGGGGGGDDFGGDDFGGDDMDTPMDDQSSNDMPQMEEETPEGDNDLDNPDSNAMPE